MVSLVLILENIYSNPHYSSVQAACNNVGPLNAGIKVVVSWSP